MEGGHSEIYLQLAESTIEISGRIDTTSRSLSDPRCCYTLFLSILQWKWSLIQFSSFSLKSSISLSESLESIKIHTCNYIFHFWKVISFPYPLLATISFLFLQQKSGKIICMHSLYFLLLIFSLSIHNHFFSPEFNKEFKTAPVKVKSYLYHLKLDVSSQSLSCLNSQLHLTPLLTPASLK